MRTCCGKAQQSFRCWDSAHWQCSNMCIVRISRSRKTHVNVLQPTDAENHSHPGDWRKKHEKISIFHFSRFRELIIILKCCQKFPIEFKFSFIKNEKLSKWEDDADIIKSHVKGWRISEFHYSQLLSFLAGEEGESFYWKNENFTESHE